jgi:hypothetical protein
MSEDNFSDSRYKEIVFREFVNAEGRRSQPSLAFGRRET